jgi:hypothetical protein
MNQNHTNVLDDINQQIDGTKSKYLRKVSMFQLFHNSIFNHRTIFFYMSTLVSLYVICNSIKYNYFDTRHGKCELISVNYVKPDDYFSYYVSNGVYKFLFHEEQVETYTSWGELLSEYLNEKIFEIEIPRINLRTSEQVKCHYNLASNKFVIDACPVLNLYYCETYKLVSWIYFIYSCAVMPGFLIAVRYFFIYIRMYSEKRVITHSLFQLYKKLSFEKRRIATDQSNGNSDQNISNLSLNGANTLQSLSAKILEVKKEEKKNKLITKIIQEETTIDWWYQKIFFFTTDTKRSPLLIMLIVIFFLGLFLGPPNNPLYLTTCEVTDIIPVTREQSIYLLKLDNLKYNFTSKPIKAECGEIRSILCVHDISKDNLSIMNYTQCPNKGKGLNDSVSVSVVFFYLMVFLFALFYFVSDRVCSIMIYIYKYRLEKLHEQLLKLEKII